MWTAPEGDAHLAAVVCHPHPMFGGTMHNKVVYQAAKALHRRGVPVLRFNFRGAGLSEGSTIEGGASRTMFARDSIIWRKNSPGGQFCSRVSVLALGWDCRWDARTNE